MENMFFSISKQHPMTSCWLNIYIYIYNKELCNKARQPSCLGSP